MLQIRNPKLMTATLALLAWSGIAFGGSEFENAAATGDVEKVKALLKENPDLVNAKGTYGRTALAWAVELNRRDVAEVLLANKADASAKSGNNTTPLHIASVCGRKEMVELLLAHGADVNAKDVAGRTPLHEAQRELTKEEAAAMSQISGGTIDFNAKPKPIPHDVEDKRFKELLELLIANKADINARDNGGETPMHIAAWFGGRKNDMVGVLLAHGADVNAKNKYDMTPLHSACWGSAWKGNKEVVKLLLEHKADTNIKAAKVFPDVEGGWTPLHIAAGGGSKEVVELLLENKADINAKTEDEKTALHFAAMRKSEDGVVDLLLAKGLNINAKDKNGKTPLHIALDGNHKDTVERLRQHGAKE